MSRYSHYRRSREEVRRDRIGICTGPVQTAVLVALRDGSALGLKELSLLTGYSTGSISGAISGMVAMYNRRWLRRHPEHGEPYQYGEPGPYVHRLFSITKAGLAAIAHVPLWPAPPPLPPEPPLSTGPFQEADLRELVKLLLEAKALPAGKFPTRAEVRREIHNTVFRLTGLIL